MGTLTARNVFLITSIVRKYKLHNVQNLYNNLYRLHTSNKTLSTVDTIDEFTTRLVKDKAKKWTAIQKRHSDECTEDLVFVNPWKIDFKSKLKDISECNKLKLDIRDLTVHQINSLISSAIDDEAFHDVEYLILQCMQNGQCPSVETILEVLSVYSFNGNIKMVTSLQRFYRLVQPEIASTNSDFNHYLAKAHWMKGNVEKALGIYVEVYGTSSSLRGTIRKMLKFLINDTIINRSEASVVILRRYAMLFGENFNEWYPMMYFWEGCWLSEWFGDQQLAETLFKDCDPLRKCLHDKLLPITQNALNNHLEDPVLRLLQLLLRVDMKSSYADVIGALFDYRHVRRDFRGCIEIMQNCVPLEITLSVLQQKKFLNLLISNGFKCPPIGQKTKEKSEKDTFPFKF